MEKKNKEIINEEAEVIIASADSLEELVRLLQLSGVVSTLDKSNHQDKVPAEVPAEVPTNPLSNQYTEEVDPNHDYGHKDYSGDAYSDEHTYTGKPETTGAGLRIVNNYGDNPLVNESEEGTTLSIEGASEMDDSFIESIDDMFGWAIANQADNIRKGGFLEDQNETAIKVIYDLALDQNKEYLVDDLASFMYSTPKEIKVQEDIEEGTTLSIEGASEMDDSFIESIDDMFGWAIANQADNIRKGGFLEDQNETAIKVIYDLALDQNKEYLVDDLASFMYSTPKEIEVQEDIEENIEEDIEENIEENEIQVGDYVHLGFGAKSGAGFYGTVVGIEGDVVTIEHENGKTYVGCKSKVTKQTKEFKDESFSENYNRILELSGIKNDIKSDITEAYINSVKDVVDTLKSLRNVAKKLETGKETYEGNFPNEYRNEIWDIYSWLEKRTNRFENPELKEIMGNLIHLRKEAQGLERVLLKTQADRLKLASFANKVAEAIYTLILWLEKNPISESLEDSLLEKRGARVNPEEDKRVRGIQSKRERGEFEKFKAASADAPTDKYAAMAKKYGLEENSFRNLMQEYLMSSKQYGKNKSKSSKKKC